MDKKEPLEAEATPDEVVRHPPDAEAEGQCYITPLGMKTILLKGRDRTDSNLHPQLNKRIP